MCFYYEIKKKCDRNDKISQTIDYFIFFQSKCINIVYVAVFNKDILWFSGSFFTSIKGILQIDT